MTKKQRIRAAEEAYLKKLTGYEYTEIKIIDEYDENSELTKRKVERVIKHVPPDTAALEEYLRQNSQTMKKDEYAGGIVILPAVREEEGYEQDSMGAAGAPEDVS